MLEVQEKESDIAVAVAPREDDVYLQSAQKNADRKIYSISRKLGIAKNVLIKKQIGINYGI